MKRYTLGDVHAEALEVMIEDLPEEQADPDGEYVFATLAGARKEALKRIKYEQNKLDAAVKRVRGKPS